MKKILIVTLIMIIVIGCLVTSFFLNIKLEQEMSREGMAIITGRYQAFGENVEQYNRIREKLNNYMESFFYETYLENEKNYIENLNEYDQVMKLIRENVEMISSRCNVMYKDAEVNKICDTYQVLYEKLVNLYISDIANYNLKITGYNDYKESNIELYIPLYSEYLDYNGDGIYEGKDK